MNTRTLPLLLALIATPMFAAWRTGGPTGGAVVAVAVAPSDAAVIWAGNAAGVFRSTDGGATWANAGGNIVDVKYLAVHPGDARKAWVLTGGPGGLQAGKLYRTADGGASWTDVTAGLPPIDPAALQIDPRNPDILYIGAHCGPIGLSASSIRPQFHENAGVFRSTDGGATWTQVSAGLTTFGRCVEELAVDPFSPWRLFLSGPFSDTGNESYDSAQTWDPPVGPRPSRGVVFDPRFPFTHYGIAMALGARFLVSQDGGFTWSEAATKPPAPPTALAIDPERGRLFLGTNEGMYRSGNSGRVWAGTLLPATYVAQLSFGSNSLFAATYDGLMQVANRGLGEARTIDLRDSATYVMSLAVDPNRPELVYAGTRVIQASGAVAPRGRVMRSADAGRSWQRVENDDDLPRGDFLSVDGAGTLFAANFSDGGIWRRGRDETKWTLVRQLPFVLDFVADPKNGGTAFMIDGDGVDRTRDNGATWQHVLETLGGPAHLAIDPSDSRWVYAPTEYQLWRSADGGDTWTVIEPFDPGKSGTRLLVVAPSDGRVLYRIAANGGRPSTERSDDRGATWTRIPLPNNDYPSALAVDPHDARSVWASGTGTLLHSTDGGATWDVATRPFTTPLSAFVLQFDPSGNVLHAVWPGHGVWELTND